MIRNVIRDLRRTLEDIEENAICTCHAIDMYDNCWCASAEAGKVLAKFFGNSKLKRRHQRGRTDKTT